MPSPFSIRIRSGYLIAFLLLLVSYFLVFSAIRQLNHSMRLLTDSYHMINDLEAIRTEIVSAETGVRGYAITRDSSFLGPYYSSSQAVLPKLQGVRKLAGTKEFYQVRMNHLDRLLNIRLESLAKSVAGYDSAGYATREMRLRREGSKVVMDSIRLLVDQMVKAEEGEIRNRQDKLKGIFNSTQIFTVASLVVALITIIFFVTFYHRENRARERADRKAADFRLELEQKVAELNEMNAELQELRSIEKFASTGRIARTMAHEVRNPLTNISLATEQLKEITANDEESEALLMMISRNAGRINQIVSDLLNATRFAQLNFEKIDFNSLMEETIELAHDRIELKNIKVEKDYSTEVCEIMADREKMKVALLNIIVNALEAMEENDGVLRLRTWRKGDKCYLEITDNGMGMNEDTIQKIFDPYFTGKNKGNGLGLTNTQNTILNHKGNIKVTSQPGLGTSFTITLNLLKEGFTGNYIESVE